jgi:murein DD-endopeptidase MepM/ murein hydrolase activator NlpD
MRNAILAFTVVLAAASIAQAGTPQTVPTPTPTPAPAPATASMQFAWPLCGPVPRGFGYETDPLTGSVSFHSGVDLKAQAGTPVRASARGRVIAAELRGPYGNVVEIDHGAGYRTRYAHLAAYRVSAGEIVGRGQVVGDVGSTGRTNGPHLHFEIWPDGWYASAGSHPIDPLPDLLAWAGAG